MGGLELLRLANLYELSGHASAAGPVLDLVAGEHLSGVLHAQHVAAEPQRHVPFRQPFVAQDAPVHEPRVAERIEDSGEANREEGAPEVFRMLAQGGGVERAPAIEGIVRLQEVLFPYLDALA